MTDRQAYEIERLREAIKELWVVCDYSQLEQLDPETAELVHDLVADEWYGAATNA